MCISIQIARNSLSQYLQPTKVAQAVHLLQKQRASTQGGGHCGATTQ